VLNSKKANAQVRIPFVGPTGMISLFALCYFWETSPKSLLLKAGVLGFVMSIKI
jgi:hypothetical protein